MYVLVLSYRTGVRQLLEIPDRESLDKRIELAKRAPEVVQIQTYTLTKTLYHQPTWSTA